MENSILLNHIQVSEREEAEIRKHSNTNRRSRFKDAPWLKESSFKMIIGGAGGIGSWFAMLAARSLPNAMISVYDFDLIETHNIGGQLFSGLQVGMSKVSAIQDLIRSYANMEVASFSCKYTSNDYASYMVSCFDNMEARQLMFDTWCSRGYDKGMFVDGRLLAEQFEVYFVPAGDREAIKKYRERLFKDSEVEDAPCTMKQTSHYAAMIAATMVAGITNYISTLNTKEAMREIPFCVKTYGELFLTSVQ